MLADCTGHMAASIILLDFKPASRTVPKILRRCKLMELINMLSNTFARRMSLAFAESAEFMIALHAFNSFIFVLSSLCKTFAIWLRTPAEIWIFIHFSG